MRRGCIVDMGVAVDVPMRMGVVMGEAMSMVGMMGGGRGGNHNGYVIL